MRSTCRVRASRRRFATIRASSKFRAISGTTCARKYKLLKTTAQRNTLMASRDSSVKMEFDGESAARIEHIARRKLRQRHALIIGLRILVLVLLLGGWELSGRLKWIDPFFFSMPSLIFLQIVDWFQNGTSQGPLLVQVWVTLEETLIGFFIGSVAGIV